MIPHATTCRERRRHRRRPVGFAFWLCADGSGDPGDRRSGWALDYSLGGFSFLTDARSAPAVGWEIELSGMPVRSRYVREHTPRLPLRARVVRIDAGQGLTRKLAVRFVDAGAVALPALEADRACGRVSIPISRSGAIRVNRV